MQRFIGEYESKVDAKGRFRLTSQLLRQIKDVANVTFVVNRGFEKHINLYTREVWEELSAKIDDLNMFDLEHRRFVRNFYKGTYELTLDGSERLLLPKSLRDYAGIEKEIALVSVRDRIEIWDKDKYDTYLDDEPANFSEIANKLAGNIGLKF